MAKKKEIQKNQSHQEQYLKLHDTAFKLAMLYPEVVRDLIKAHIPSFITEQTRWNSLKSCKEGFLYPRLGDRFADALFSAEFKKGKGYFYVLCELQSKPDKLMVIRLWEYILKIIRSHLKQHGAHAEYPIVVPVLLSNHTKKYPYSMDLLDYFDENRDLAEKVLYQPFKLVDLSQIPDEQLRAHKWAGLMEFCLKYSRDLHIIRHFKEQSVFSMMRELGDGNKVAEYVIEMLQYIVYTVNRTQEIDISKQVIKELPEYKEVIMSLGDRLIEQGRQEGRQETILIIARNLLADGMTIKKVKELTSLSYKEIHELKTELMDK